MAIFGSFSTLGDSPRHRCTFGDRGAVTGLRRRHDKVTMVMTDTEIGLGDWDLTMATIAEFDPIRPARWI